MSRYRSFWIAHTDVGCFLYIIWSSVANIPPKKYSFSFSQFVQPGFLHITLRLQFKAKKCSGWHIKYLYQVFYFGELEINFVIILSFSYYVSAKTADQVSYCNE